ncbi:MAG: mandelate racemase/muconate lactonizing enzyme family protein [Flavobacteriales bacterium]|nr:mandelate racemase/muconate lactonizing enzyme family protein [Flavobacteriales bacterium]
MVISDIEFYNVKIPLAKNKPGFFADHAYFEPNWIPGFRQSEMRFYLLKLTTDTGVEGFAAMPSMSTERDGLGAMLGNYILGIDPMNIKLVNQRIQEFAYLGMRSGWVDAAFWDIIGKVKGEPLYKLFGGSGGSVAPYASTGCNYGHNPKASQELALKRRDEGYKGIKFRVKSTNIQQMLDYVAAGRDAVGDSMKIMVDANQGWPVDIVDETPKWDLETATAFAKGLEPLNPYWLEEPLNKGNLHGLAELRKSTTTPIAGGEMNSSWIEFKNMLSQGSFDVYQPDAVLVGGTYAGGISVTRWIIDEIKKRNAAGETLRFCPHTWTTGLGFAVAMQIVGMLDEKDRSLVEYPLEGFWNPSMWARFIKNDVSGIQSDGTIKIPDLPGLGVEIDMKVIRRFGKLVYKGNKTRVALFTLKDRGWKQTMYLKDKKKEQLERYANVKFEIPEPPF